MKIPDEEMEQIHLQPHRDSSTKNERSAALQSLNMLVVTEGKERTASEYGALLRSGGFSVIEAKKTGEYLDVILARKL